MKKFLVILLAVLCCFAAFAADADEPIEISEEELNAAYQYFSYYCGAAAFSTYYQQYSVDLNYFMQGVNDAANDTFQLTEDQVNSAAYIFLSYYYQVIAAQNLEYANNFLAENAKAAGVKTTKTGLQYRVDVKGTGKTPKKGNTVTFNYTLYGPDGQTVIDEAEGAQLILDEDHSIKGFVEVCTLVPVGSKITAWMPPELGYGENGSGDAIMPNQLLVFEIELVSIN